MDALISVCPNMSNCYTEEGHSPQLNMQITLRTSKLTSDFSLFFFLFIWKFLFSLQLDRRRDRLLLRFKLHIHIYSKSSYIYERDREWEWERKELKNRINERNWWHACYTMSIHMVIHHERMSDDGQERKSKIENKRTHLHGESVTIFCAKLLLI